MFWLLSVAPSPAKRFLEVNINHKKMKFTPWFFKYARSPQNVDTVPLKPVAQLSLKNKVSGSLKSGSENRCLYEMSLLLKCWADNQFNDKLCSQHMETLNDCYKRYKVLVKEQKKLVKCDIPTPNAKSFTSKQINYLLRMYPTV